MIGGSRGQPLRAASVTSPSVPTVTLHRRNLLVHRFRHLLYGAWHARSGRPPCEEVIPCSHTCPLRDPERSDAVAGLVTFLLCFPSTFLSVVTQLNWVRQTTQLSSPSPRQCRLETCSRGVLSRSCCGLRGFVRGARFKFCSYIVCSNRRKELNFKFNVLKRSAE